MKNRLIMISVIVPIYNVVTLLPRCINSLLAQSFSDFEIILVDDGSTDQSGLICDQYAEKDERIRVLHKTNGGLSDARNAGLSVASGQWVSFVDSDDWVSIDFLKVLYETAENTNADIVECGVIRVTDEYSQTINVDTPDAIVFETEEALKELICDGCFRQHVWNKIYRSSCIDSVLFEVGKTNEDEFWTYQIFGRSQRIVKIDYPLYFYYQRIGSIMQTNYNLKRLDALEGKANRQDYIRDNYPDLASIAKRNLISSCIYAGQMSQKYLDKYDLDKAVNIINRIRTQYPLAKEDLIKLKFKERLWLDLSRMSFWGTVKLRNLFGKGF